MKKFKLISSLCMLILAIGCLAFGVYSATNASFSMSGRIAFKSESVYFSVVGNVYQGAKGTAESTLTATTPLKTFSAQNYSGAVGSSASTGTTNNAVWNIGSDITLTEDNDFVLVSLTFTNRSEFPITVEVEDNTLITTEGVTTIIDYGCSEIGTEVGNNTGTYKIAIQVSDYTQNSTVNFDGVKFIVKEAPFVGIKLNSSYLYYGYYPQTEITDTIGLVKYNTGAYQPNQFVAYNSKNFKVEPIKWNVMPQLTASADGENVYALITDIVIDCFGAFDTRGTYYANWGESALKNDLNTTFINTAFTTAQKDRIQERAYTYEGYTTNSNSSYNASLSASSKIWVLSKSECEAEYTTDAARKTPCSAYSKARGSSTYDNGSYCWLRSASSSHFTYGYGVGHRGGVNVNSVSFSFVGVRPALLLSI